MNQGKKKPKHSPLPWRAIEHNSFCTSIVDADGFTVCQFSIDEEVSEKDFPKHKAKQTENVKLVLDLCVL